MTRDEATDKVRKAMAVGDGEGNVCAHLMAPQQIEANIELLEALGLIKFDEPAPDVEGAINALETVELPANRLARPGTGWMIGHYGAERIIATLNGAGYRVSKANP